jgi:methylase of polypeptide subunit release factors
MPDAAARFSGFAAKYDAVRPRPPASLVQVIMQWAGASSPAVVDLGAGTGLSTVIWAGHAGTVTAVEPSAAGASEDELGLTALREVAARRLPRPRTWWWTYRIRLAVK